MKKIRFICKLLALNFILLPAGIIQANALAVVQHKVNASAAGGTSLSVTVTATGGGNLLVAATMTKNAALVTSVSDGSNNFIRVGGAYQSGSNNSATDVWYWPKSSSGVTSITVNFNGATTNFCSMEVWEVSGFTLPVVDKAATISGTQSGGVATGAAVVTRTTNEFVVASDWTGGAVTANPKAGNEFTSGGDLDAGNDGFVSLIASTAASHQPAWTDNGANFTSSTVAFMEATSTYINNAKVGKAKLGF